MATELLPALVDFLGVLRPAFTRPGFDNMFVLFVGWVLTGGPHAVTQALVMTSVAGRRHHEAFHRFFSRGTWQPDEIGRRLLFWMLEHVPADAPIKLVIDDTVAPKKGAKVFGIGSHIDAVRSTRLCRVFTFGHCWVALAVLVRVPFSKRPWALPVLFRLYRNKKECEKKGHVYRKKTELAREMLDVVLAWTQGARRIECTADSAYGNDTVLSDLHASLVFVGAMRPDAVLTELPLQREPGKAGRPRLRGKTLPKPSALAKDERHRWQTCTAHLYGKDERVRYKECFGQWYRACGVRLLRIVIVQVETGTIGLRVYFSTDPKMTVRQILETYAGRWSIEVCFKNLKQLMGFADSSARKQAAVERTAPFVGFSYTVLVLWFAQHAYGTLLATPPLRPWYPHKQGASFADILRTAQRVLGPLDVLDPGRSVEDLQELPPGVVPLRAHRRNRGAGAAAPPRRRAA